jgi:hypothetical protein
MDRNLPSALRVMADVIKSGNMESLHPRAEGVGGPRHDPRAHVLASYCLVAEVFRKGGDDTSLED